jgi:hypothetical protein
MPEVSTQLEELCTKIYHTYHEPMFQSFRHLLQWVISTVTAALNSVRAGVGDGVGRDGSGVARHGDDGGDEL